jgi:pullulanase/glycogen debranching enzyme
MALICTVLLFSGSADGETPISGNEQTECNRPEFQSVLQPTAPIDARAVWINRNLIKWHRAAVVPEGSHFRLYHGVVGEIVALPGGPVLGAEGVLKMSIRRSGIPAALSARYNYLGDGLLMQLPPLTSAQQRRLLTQQLVIVNESSDGKVIDATGMQLAGALDDLYRKAEGASDFGATVTQTRILTITGFKLWAPTARRVSLCLYETPMADAISVKPMRFDAQTGIWTYRAEADLSSRYYTFLVDVFVRGVGWVRNRVTDPYSLGLTADSRRSYVANLDRNEFEPPEWKSTRRPNTVSAPTDMVIYELHVRDFSINDATVSRANRGRYLAFTETESNGMKHLKALAASGMTDIHLLPVFDIASIPEAGCVNPNPAGAAASKSQQGTVMATSSNDCYNWGYDPLHYTVPEGSYASDAAQAATRIIEFRRMVQALHHAGLRVGMDVVYNHTPAAGQHIHSVLDRIVPGYYQRLNSAGMVETSTCCANTATEHRMMGKLMSDSVVTWARDYHIDSFRFDLMGHHPREVMENIKARLRAITGREIQLIGEGWNFGEVANDARFVQASQLALNGSGIGTFSDRARDAVRGGSAADNRENLSKRQGYVNGMVFDPNPFADTHITRKELMQTADLVRVGLAGSVRSYPLLNFHDNVVTLEKIDYNGQPAGYASQPFEVVNYVENHDNQTLFDINVFRLPRQTSTADRARVQILAAAINAFSQGVAYFHAGMDVLRSKSLDRNSYDSGDWFNRLDWTYTDNYFGVGLPPANDNEESWPLMAPLLTDSTIKPRPADIAWTRDAFRDLLKIRASSSLFRLRSADEIVKRLHFFNTGSTQVPTVLAVRLLGDGLPDSGFKEVVYLINVDKVSHKVGHADLANKRLTLHPVHLAPGAADKRVGAEATYESGSGTFTVPPRSAVVFVVS